MNRPQPSLRILIAVVTGAVALVGCSSGGGSDAVPTSTATTSVVSTTVSEAATVETIAAVPLDPPTATLPQLDPSMEGGWRPVDVVGDALPQMPVDGSADPAIGLPLPVLTGYDVDGNVIRIDPANQGKTMIVGLAHWCAHCNREVPVINELQANTALPSDLNVVAVLTGSNPKRPNWPPVEWIKGMKWPYPAMVDGVTVVPVDGKDEAVPVSMWYYGFQGFPTVLLVDEKGIVVTRWGGEAGYDEIIERVDEALYATP